MNIQALKALIDLFGQAPLRELEISEGGQTLKITRTELGEQQQPQAPTCAEPTAAVPDTVVETPPAKPPVAPTPPSEHTLSAPMYGTLHLSPTPDAPPFVSVGDTLSVGQQIGLIEAMKVFTPVKTTLSGRVEAILVTDGTEVEADQPLMRLS